MLTGLIFGIAPALHASRQDLSSALKGFGRPGLAASSGQRLRSAFVVGQISLAVALSLGAGLMIQSLLRLGAVDIGVDTRALVTFQLHLDGRDYLRDTGGSTPSGAAATELTPRLFTAAEQIRERLAGIAGIQAASAMMATAPLSGSARRYGFVAAGSKATGPDRQPPATDWFAVLPDYFRTLGAPMLKGRDFSASDTVAGLPVVVINKTMADELWPGENPIGREIQMRLFNDSPARSSASLPTCAIAQGSRAGSARRTFPSPKCGRSSRAWSRTGSNVSRLSSGPGRRDEAGRGLSRRCRGRQSRGQ